MPQTCESCNIDWPDGVNPGRQGLVQINYCPSCGNEVGG